MSGKDRKGVVLIATQCLRYIYRYIRTKDQQCLKRKVWDEVTGTICNIPILKSKDDPSDDEMNHVALNRDGPGSDGPKANMFPLRIHRRPLYPFLERTSH